MKSTATDEYTVWDFNWGIFWGVFCGYVAGRIVYSLLRWVTEMYIVVFPRGGDHD
jgi:hypothetical protein